MESEFMNYWDIKGHRVETLYADLYLTAWSFLFHWSANAGEWLKNMELRVSSELSSDYCERINEVIELSREILKGVPEMTRITAISFVDRLKKIFLGNESNSAVKLGPFTYADIEIIKSVLFDSFRSCCNRMGDDEFDFDFKKLVEEYEIQKPIMCQLLRSQAN